MNTHLAPTLIRSLDKYHLLWFSISNTYNIIDQNFYNLLNLYFGADDGLDLKQQLLKTTIIPQEIADDTIIEITNYLNQCNKQETYTDELLPKKPGKQTPIIKYISVLNKKIRLNFDSEIVEKTIFPPLRHLEVFSKNDAEIDFKFYLDSGFLYLFKNNKIVIKVPKLDYHLLQGKFIFQLLCVIHNKLEADWIGTFHACTIAKGKEAVLLTGLSGKGKSTLSCLLAASGFTLVADDVSALSAIDLNIYYNPLAVSIKSGSFNLLQPIIPQLDKLPVVQFNPAKGKMKYIPFKIPKQVQYNCRAIILVNYKKNAETSIDHVNLPEVLGAFIEDSWLSSKLEHAQQFMNWLETQRFYKLTYSDTQSAIIAINQIFK